MSRKYVLCPGYVRSQFDGDEHYINERQLADLYGVKLEDCMLETDKTRTDIWKHPANPQPYFLGIDYAKEVDKCLHKNCPECHGNGVKLNGEICIHMISCPCPRCTLRC